MGLDMDDGDGYAWLERIERRYGAPTKTTGSYSTWKNPTAGISIITVFGMPCFEPEHDELCKDYLSILDIDDDCESCSMWHVEWFSTETAYESYRAISVTQAPSPSVPATQAPIVLNIMLGAELPPNWHYLPKCDRRSIECLFQEDSGVLNMEGGGLKITEVPEPHALCGTQTVMSQDGSIIGVRCSGLDWQGPDDFLPPRAGHDWLGRIVRRYGEPTKKTGEALHTGLRFTWKNPTAGISVITVNYLYRHNDDNGDHTECYTPSMNCNGAWDVEWFSTETTYEDSQDIAKAIRKANESNVAF